MTQYDDNYGRKSLDFDTGDPIPGVHVKAVYDELGAAPRGSSSTVRDRLDALASDVAGKAAFGHAHDTLAITSGVFGPERLGTGTASSGTFLRGDGRWESVSATIPGVLVLDAGVAVPSGTPVGTIILRRAS